MRSIAVLAIAVLLASTAPAHAAFLVAPIIAAVGAVGSAITAGGIVGSLAGSALAYGASYIAGQLLKPKEKPLPKITAPTATGPRAQTRPAASSLTSAPMRTCLKA
ncbi:hypothetical protein A7A08_01715 [Methyloligella halotolerans]|uniref:Uncharacterized protein n=1 Tax=Methyloligella halotolerans TaxID=1177755 RepID=A0A1E2RZU4_9HYPH|nr:hypothetical protein [Methyloligella halotolerans]ODA67680.1 hypothetical protein A7A08_01715 [Methyloligella halotolerans]